MKRDGYIIEEIIDQQNLEDSFDEVIRGKLRKEILVEGKWLIKHREKFLQSVREEILSGHISLSATNAHRQHTSFLGIFLNKNLSNITTAMSQLASILIFNNP